MTVTIRANARGSHEVSTTARWAARLCWDKGAQLYAVVQDSGATPKVRVVKGDAYPSPTSFAEQDSGDNKTIANVDYPFSSWLHTNGDLHVVVFTGTNTITHYLFDTDTDQWVTGFGTVTTGASNEHAIRVVVRSDGDVLVGFTSSADDADIGWARWEGSSWTVDVTGLLSTSFAVSSNIFDALIDSTDRAFFFMASVTSGVRGRSINSANTVSTSLSIEASGADETNRNSGRFNLYDNAGNDTVIFPYVLGTGSLTEQVVALESDIAAGSLSGATTVEGTSTDVGVRTPISTAVIGGVPYCAWWDDASSGTLKYSTKSGGSWAAETNFATGITRLIEIVPVSTDGLMIVYQSGSNVVMDWIVAPSTSAPASLTVTAAASSAAGEAVTLDAASKLTVTEATAPAAGQAVTLKGQGALAVTPAAAPAQGEAVTLDAASIFTVTSATAPAAGGNVTLAGQGRLPVTEATSPAAGGNVTFTAAALFTIDDAEAPAAAGNVNLAAAAAASLDVTAATASAAADGALTGQGRLPVTAAEAPAAGGNVTFVAAARFTIDDAEAPAAGGNVNLTAGAAASLTVSPAAADAQGEAVTLDAAAVMAIDAAAAAAQGEAVTLDVAARLIVDAATASAAGQNVTLHGQGVLGVTETLASAEGENVILFGGTSIPGTLAVAPATSAAAGEGVTLDAAAVFTAGTATAPAQGENVTLDAAAVLAVSAASATAAGETVGLIGQAVITITPASAPAAADGAFAAAAVMTIDSALANAAAGNVELVGAVPGDLYFRLITARVLTLHVEAEPVLLYKRSAEPALTFAMKGDYDGSN